MERTAMSDRDSVRVSVLSRMVTGELTSVGGAELLAVSVRQLKHLKMTPLPTALQLAASASQVDSGQTVTFTASAIPRS